MNFFGKLFKFVIDKRNIKLIKNSIYFDEDYYRKSCEDVHGNLAEDYYYFGWKEGKDPSGLFSTDFYLETYDDVKKLGINPLAHYLLYGKNKNRKVTESEAVDLEDIELVRESTLFDEKYYHCKYPEAEGDLATHFCVYGWKEGNSPSFDFSTSAYLKKYKDVADANYNPLIHYLKFGANEGREIEKDYGEYFYQIYNEIQNFQYFYNIYLSKNDTDEMRINFITKTFCENIEQMLPCLKFLFLYCEKENVSLRVVYKEIDFQHLKKALNDNDLHLPTKIEFINLKESNYLDITQNDTFVCIEWIVAKALLNTPAICSKIYLFCDDSVTNLSKYDRFQLANILENPNVICLTNDKVELKNIKLERIKFSLENSKSMLKNSEKYHLYCDFGKYYIDGLELFDNIFRNQDLTGEKWEVKFLNAKKHQTLQSTADIFRTDAIKEEADLLISFSLENDNDKPFILINLELDDIQCDEFINVFDLDAKLQIIEKTKWSIKESKTYRELVECIHCIGGDYV